MTRSMFPRWLLALALGVGSAAMAVGYQPGTGPAYPPATPGIQYVDGNYIVPAPTNLARFASWDTKYGITVGADGKMTIDYCLPEDVVGPDAPSIHLTERAHLDSGLYEFRGTFGKASCYKTDKVVTCFVIYPGFPIDKEKVRSLLREKYGHAAADDQAELDARFALADVFSADPKGVVNLTRP